jgi:hypothetical protein
MINVHMGNHNPTNITRGKAEATKLWTDLIVWSNGEAKRESIERLPPREVAFLGGTGSCSGIDDYETFWMLDHPGVDGKGLSPFLIGQDIEEPLRSLASTDLLSRFDAHRSCLNGVDAKHTGFSPFDQDLVDAPLRYGMRSTFPLVWRPSRY